MDWIGLDWMDWMNWIEWIGWIGSDWIFQRAKEAMVPIENITSFSRRKVICEKIYTKIGAHHNNLYTLVRTPFLTLTSRFLDAIMPASAVTQPS